MRRAVLTVLLLALAVRAQGLARESFWRDEVDAVLFASAPWPELLSAFARPAHNGAAYHVALRLWIDAAGTSEYAVRYFSTLGDLIALSLVASIGCRLVGPAVGLAAAVAWAVLPAAVWYAQEAKMYAWLAAVAAACLRFSLGSTALRAAAVGLAVAAAFWHYFALLLVLPALVALARGLPVAPRRTPLVALLGGLLVAGVLALLLGREWQTLLRPRPTGHPFAPLAEIAPRLLFGLTLNTPPLGWPLGALLAAPLAAAAVLARARLPWLWLLLPVAAFYPVSLLLPLFAERYFVILLPPLVVLAAVGVVAAARRHRALALVGAPALLIALLTLYQQQRITVKADYRALGAHLRAEARAGDGLMVVMPYNARAVRFYAGEALPLLETPAGGGPSERLEAEGGRAVDRHERLWLVRAEEEQHDPAGAIAAWLAGRARRVETREWTGLRLELYRRG